MNKAAQVAGALYHRSSMKSTSRLTQCFQGSDASFIKEKLLQKQSVFELLKSRNQPQNLTLSLGFPSHIYNNIT